MNVKLLGFLVIFNVKVAVCSLLLFLAFTVIVYVATSIELPFLAEIAPVTGSIFSLSVNRESKSTNEYVSSSPSTSSGVNSNATPCTFS